VKNQANRLIRAELTGRRRAFSKTILEVPHQPISLFMTVLDSSRQALSIDPLSGSIGIIFEKLLSRNRVLDS